MEKYTDYEKQITEFLDNMDENDYMQSFLYLLDYIECDLIKVPTAAVVEKKDNDEDGTVIQSSATRDSEA